MGTILIVDDHPDTCRMLEVHLCSLGHVAECVTSPSEAAAILRSSLTGLIFLDVMMGEGPGGLDLL